MPSIDRFSKRLAIVVAVGLGLLLAWRGIDLILLGVGAAVVASIIRAIADPVAAHTPLPTSVAVIAAVLLIVVALGGAILLFGFQIGSQLQDVVSRAPEAWRRLKTWIAHEPFGQELLQAFGRLPGAHGHGLASRVSGWAMSIADVVTNLILVAVSGAYLAAKPGTYRKGLMTLLPDSAQDAAGAVLDRASAALRGWLKAQAISMALVGVLSGVGLWLAGVPSPVALGLLAGLAEFIPLAGPPLAAIPAVLMGLTVGTATAGWSLVVFVIVQQLESNAITPLVQKKVVDIPPLVTLFALAFAGLLFGALGVVLAGPLTVLIFVAVRELYVRRILKRGDGRSAESA